jgi:hypothetical protein
MKPLATTIDVPPSFKMNTFWIFSTEKISFEFFIRGPWPIPFKMSFAAWA